MTSHQETLETLRVWRRRGFSYQVTNGVMHQHWPCSPHIMFECQMEGTIERPVCPESTAVAEAPVTKNRFMKSQLQVWIPSANQTGQW